MKKPTKAKKTAVKKRVAAITHGAQSRPNIPTAEMEGLVASDDAQSVSVDYQRKHNPDEIPAHYARDTDLDPQLVWTGKDDEDRQPLHIKVAPIYVQEKISPRAIIEDLRQRADAIRGQQPGAMDNLFTDFNGLPEDARIQFYQHAQKWTNRMILGDSLMVMASLAHKEGLKGKVQCVYMDPPYGINYNSNWQPSTKSRAVKDKDESHEPEMIRAFRDTWKLGINSYLSYLRDRLVAARDLLTESGSIFLQISDENVHLVRSLMDEIFGRENFMSQITYRTTAPLVSKFLTTNYDFLIWYAKSKPNVKFWSLFESKEIGANTNYMWVDDFNGERRRFTAEESKNLANVKGKVFYPSDFASTGYTLSCTYDFDFENLKVSAGKKSWRTHKEGLSTLIKARRIMLLGTNNRPCFVQYHSDNPYQQIPNVWTDTRSAMNMRFVVETASSVIQRCLLMTTDPGDLVLDPTCGSGTTAAVAEQWGRRWITCDTSRVALALARARLMGNSYPYYLLQDSKEGADKETQLTNQLHNKTAFGEDVRHGFVCERVPHVTLKSIANNAEIAEIHQHFQDELESLRATLNSESQNNFAEWEIPTEAAKEWNAAAKTAHRQYREIWQKRRRQIDDSIARNADIEMLVDRPYEAKNTVRVTGPFTVESLSPHRIVSPNNESEARPKSETENESRFWEVIYENLKVAGVQNTRKNERLEFMELDPWPSGELIQFAGRYLQKNGKEKKVAVCVGPEYGTVTRSLLVNAAREAADMFDMLVVLGFAFEPHADENMTSLGPLPVWRVRMNNDLHMGERLSSGKTAGNLFVSFGEPDIEYRQTADDMIEVEILGIDIFDPTTGELKPSGVQDIACWMIDTDYDEQSFFVRHAYFCGEGKDPYKQLKRALKAEISTELWDTLRASVSRPFAKPTTGKIAVKAINHHGDEVMKVFRIA